LNNFKWQMLRYRNYVSALARYDRNYVSVLARYDRNYVSALARYDRKMAKFHRRN
jgi:hypothetical protein